MGSSLGREGCCNASSQAQQLDAETISSVRFDTEIGSANGHTRTGCTTPTHAKHLGLAPGWCKSEDFASPSTTASVPEGRIDSFSVASMQPIESDVENESESADPSTAARRVPLSENPFDGISSPEEALHEALRQARTLMNLQTYDVLAAEEVLAQALASLEARAGSGDGKMVAECEECLDRLKSSDVFTDVSDRVAQFDAATEILYNKNMETLFENEHGRFEISVAPEGTWFDYRMTVDIDAPLAECLSTGNEMDLVPQAQPLVGSADLVGPCSGVNLKYIFYLSVLMFRAELLVEIIRHRGRKLGYLLEVARSEFPHDPEHTPSKAFGAIRPWIYCTNLWMPRGDGKRGTTIVQVTRVDITIPLPAWVLNFVFRKMSTSFIADLRSGALKANEPTSPWASRIRSDADGFYRELRKLEETSHGREEVRARRLPGKDIFDRGWRLRPTPIDTRPPSSR